jgi:hypothetical protein
MSIVLFGATHYVREVTIAMAIVGVPGEELRALSLLAGSEGTL